MIFQREKNVDSGRMRGKAGVITGAASGIGRAAAVLFAQNGAKLALADMNQGELAQTTRLVEEAGGEVFSQVVDVAEEEQVRALIDEAAKRFGQLDFICNNAGITGKMATLETEDPADWLRVYAVNVLGAMFGCKHAAPHLIARGGGAIVNTSSVAGVRAGAGGNAYSASKAALINFTRTAACDLGQFNVRVNAVCPGLIETGMTKPVFDYARQAGKEAKLGSRCELRRYGRPEEIATAMLFLASDESSYITGQALPVDGGNTCSLNLPGMKY